MTGRLGRDRRVQQKRASTSFVFTDPFVSLSADRAWRAQDAVDNGSVTTSLPSYVGSSTPLALAGSGQAIKATSANLGSRSSVTFTGAAGSYSAVALAGDPTSFTIVSVFRLGAGDPSAGVTALTVAGGVNTGVAQLNQSGQLTSRKAAVANAQTVSANANYVMVSIYDASGVTHYVNKKSSPVTAVGAGALVGTTFQVGALSTPGNIFTFAGEWATSGYWTRALSAGEAATVLDQFGGYYGITIAP